MKDWFSNVYKGFIISAIIAFIIGMFTQGSASLGAYISGYSVLSISIMMILLILFNKIMDFTQGQSAFKIISVILMTTGPFILMLGYVSFILYLIITYKDNINSGHVSPSYYSFSNIGLMLLLIQLYIVYTNISTSKFETTGQISKVSSSIILLLSVLTLICSVIIFTILKYFTTDGFTSK
jgi:hypothetical protein